ncbi:MAG: hypothetical protein ACRCSF_12390 [Mycobacteriaceae bacterium]
MNLRKSVIAGVALIAALSISACGDEGKKSDSTSSKTTSVMVSTEAAPTPTAEQLNAYLVKALDPAVPAAEKTVLVQGSEADPALFDQLIAGTQNNKVTAKVIDPVLVDGTTATAAIELTLDGQLNQANAEFVYENGTWKLSNVWACSLLKTLSVTSPACPV